jgi:hypothetical protein
VSENLDKAKLKIELKEEEKYGWIKDDIML